VANVLISYFSPVIDYGQYQSICFYDAMISDLVSCGNDVSQIISSEFIKGPWNGSNELLDDIDDVKLLNDVIEFGPDLCIFFNNSVPDILYDVIECPVILFLADSVNYFNDKETIKNKLLDRVYFYAPFQRDVEEIKAIFGVEGDRVINLLPATGVINESIAVDKDVSFIGTNFLNTDGLGQLLLVFKDRRRLKYIINIIRECASDAGDVLTDVEKDFICQYMSVAEFSFMFSPRNRVATLAALTDLDLNIYGGDDWGNLASYFPSCYVPAKIYSLKHNQDIYNSSRVCLSISHTQAVGGFPWRSMDVMASNGCLLSDWKLELRDFTKGFIELPMYKSVSEARELCKKLLRDDSWRKDIVVASQLCIEEKGRWKHRFKSLDDILELQLIGNTSRAEPAKVINIRENRMLDSPNHPHHICLNLNQLVPPMSPLCFLVKT